MQKSHISILQVFTDNKRLSRAKKTNPNQTQYKLDMHPKQSQFKPKQSQNRNDSKRVLHLGIK